MVPDRLKTKNQIWSEIGDLIEQTTISNDTVKAVMSSGRYNMQALTDCGFSYTDRRCKVKKKTKVDPEEFSRRVIIKTRHNEVIERYRRRIAKAIKEYEVEEIEEILQEIEKF